MAQLHLGPTHVRIRPLNSRKLVAVLCSLGMLFHTRADSNLNDICPYVTVLTVSILTVFSYLKEYFVCLSSTKSLRYSGDIISVINTLVCFCSNASQSIHVKCWKIHFVQKALIARNIIIKNNYESSVLELFLISQYLPCYRNAIQGDNS